MSTAIIKVHKASGKGVLTAFEKKFSNVLCNIQDSTSPIAKELKTLYVHKVVTLPINQATKCAVIYVPMPFLQRFKKIGTNLIAELEKKIPNHQFVIVGDRKIIRERDVKGGKQRPFTHTVTHVHDAMLEDIVYPQHITGKQKVYSADGSIKINVNLSRGVDNSHRFAGYSTAYKTLTGKTARFITDM